MSAGNMMVIKQKFIYRTDLRNNPDVYYLFGDNDSRQGLGGQAKEMRGEPNAIGVRTKKLPTMDNNAFYSDTELFENCKKIDEDMSKAFIVVSEGHVVVLPTDGLGSGMAELKKHAPKTKDYLDGMIDMLINFDGREF